MNPGKSLLWLILVLIATACSKSPASPEDPVATPTALADDEVIQFFPTSAWFDPQQDVWQIPLHGWVHEPQSSSARKALFAKALKEKYDLVPSAMTSTNFDERVNLIIADNERGKLVSVSIAGLDHTLRPSTANGHFRHTITLPAARVSAHAKQGTLPYQAITDAAIPRVFTGTVQLISPEGTSIISDIDDTIKISNVTDRKQLLEYAFFRDFEAASGMASRYNQWAQQGASIHYVSSSPWQLYSPLREFMHTAGFPVHTMNLKNVRFRDQSLLNLLKKGTETKPAQIEPILKKYPSRKFVLIGDSGEQDPEVYATLMRKYPDQIIQIFIRNVTNASTTDQRMKSVFEGLASEKWELFDHPKKLAIPSL